MPGAGENSGEVEKLLNGHKGFYLEMVEMF